MAQIFTRSGLRITAIPDARGLYRRDVIEQMGRDGMAFRRGSWVGVRVERPAFRDCRKDETLGEILWVPVADADCLYEPDDGPGGTFTVVESPRCGEIVNFQLDNLDPDEKQDLMRDLRRI